MKEHGMTTQAPTRAGIRSGTEGTRERVWTPPHKVAAVTNIRKKVEQHKEKEAVHFSEFGVWGFNSKEHFKKKEKKGCGYKSMKEK